MLKLSHGLSLSVFFMAFSVVFTSFAEEEKLKPVGRSVVVIPRKSNDPVKDTKAALKAAGLAGHEETQLTYDKTGTLAWTFGGGAVDLVLLNLRGGLSVYDHAFVLGVQGLGTWGLWGTGAYMQVSVPATGKRLYFYGQGLSFNSPGTWIGGGLGYRHTFNLDLTPTYDQYIAHEVHAVDPTVAHAEYEVYKADYIKKYGRKQKKIAKFWYLEIGAIRPSPSSCQNNCDEGWIPTINFGAMGAGGIQYGEIR